MEKNKKILIIVLSILVVALIGVGVYFGFIKKDDDENSFNSNTDIIEILKVYEFKDGYENDTVLLDVDGYAYVVSEKGKEYTIKNIGSYGNNASFHGVKLDVRDVSKVYKVFYGNGPDHYLAFLTKENRLYITHNYSLSLMTSDKLLNIKDVIDEEICENENGDKICVMEAYAINDKNEKISLYSIEHSLN